MRNREYPMTIRGNELIKGDPQKARIKKGRKESITFEKQHRQFQTKIDPLGSLVFEERRFASLDPFHPTWL